MIVLLYLVAKFFNMFLKILFMN